MREEDSASLEGHGASGSEEGTRIGSIARVYHGDRREEPASRYSPRARVYVHITGRRGGSLSNKYRARNGRMNTGKNRGMTNCGSSSGALAFSSRGFQRIFERGRTVPWILRTQEFLYISVLSSPSFTLFSLSEKSEF